MLLMGLDKSEQPIEFILVFCIFGWFIFWTKQY